MHEAGLDYSVQDARQLAATLNAQLEIGVAQAEAKKEQADLAFKNAVNSRVQKPTKKSRIK